MPTYTFRQLFKTNIMKKIISITFSVLFGALSLSANNNKGGLDTLVVTTQPFMTCSGCKNRIMENIRFVKGTKKITTSLPKQQVTIVYDKSKASFKAYSDAFAKIGYKIKELKRTK